MALYQYQLCAPCHGKELENGEVDGGENNRGEFVKWTYPLALAVVVPYTILFLFYTDLSPWSVSLICFLNQHQLDTIGTIMFGLSFILVLVLYMLDWPNWGSSWGDKEESSPPDMQETIGDHFSKWQIVWALIPWVLWTLGTFCYGLVFPSLSRTFIVLQIPIFVIFIRSFGDGRAVKKWGFYCALRMVIFGVSLISFTICLGYFLADLEGHWWPSSQNKLARELDFLYSHTDKTGKTIISTNCSDIKGDFTDANELLAKAESICKHAESIVFTLWVTPLLLASVGFISALVYSIFHHIIWRTRSLQAMPEILNNPGIFLFFDLTIIFGVIYIAASMDNINVDLWNGVLGLSFLALGFGMFYAIWYAPATAVEDSIKRGKKNPRVQQVGTLFENEWVKAMMVGTGIVALFWFLEKVRTKMSKKLSSRYSKAAHKIMDIINNWNMCSILIKVCLLGELYFMLQVGGTKATYVFLSWMNEQLLQSSYMIMLALVFTVGLVMFLLPPVPGVPVYIFCGIVVAKEREGIPFWLGCAIAIGLAMVLKLVACTGQYYLGYYAGSNIRIQKFVGADTKATRAIAKLMNGEFCLGKVAVLVGGPDWPTSVTCGILKVNIFRMLLATCPVLLTMAPTVFAGAYLSKVPPCETKTNDAILANAFTLIAAVGQLGSMLVAMYFIRKTYDEDESLNKPPEDPAQLEIFNQVTNLRKEEQEADAAYKDALKDTKLMSFWGLIIRLAAIFSVFSNAVFTSDFAFENFSVSGKISANLDNCGLGKNPWNIVKLPGRIALIFFWFSVILHVLFVWVKTKQAKKPN